MAAPIPVKSECLLLFAKTFSCYEMQQLILEIGNAIQWVIEPYCTRIIYGTGHWRYLAIVNYDRKILKYSQLAQRQYIISKSVCGHKVNRGLYYKKFRRILSRIVVSQSVCHCQPIFSQSNICGQSQALLEHLYGTSI